MNALRVGIAGYGVVGRRRHEALTANGATVVAVCDVNNAVSGYLPQGTAFFNTYTELLELDLDAVFICLTNDLAAEVTLQALQRRLHVFCEKPPARHPDELKKVESYFADIPDHKQVLMYGFNHRYHDSVEEAARIVTSGELGDIVSMRGLYGKSRLITFDQSDWRTRKEIAGGGVLLDQGIHLVDLMTWFSGGFSEFKSYVSSDFWGFDVEDNVFAIMRSSSGVVASVVSSATQWQHKFELQITLTKGLITLSGLLTGSKSYGEERITYSGMDVETNKGNLIERTIKYNEDNSWYKEVHAFLECIHDGRAPEIGSITDAVRTLNHVYKIYDADSTWQS